MTTIQEIKSLIAAETTYYKPENYGALGDGTTNDAAAFNAAIAAMPTRGGILYLSNKTYLLNSSVTVDRPVIFLGQNALGQTFINNTPTGTTLLNTNGNIDMIITTSLGVSFSSIYLYCNITATSGSAIKIQNSGYQIFFYNCTFEGFYDQSNWVIGVYCRVSHCHFHNPVHYGLKINNTSNPDLGDHFISDTAFGSVTGNPAMIRYESGGGLKISGCKWNAANPGFQYGLDLAMLIGSTLDLIVTNNSIENFTVSAMRLVASASFAFGQVVISSNQISGYFNTGAIIDATRIYSMCINGNVISKGSSGEAIKLTSCTDPVVGINNYRSFTSNAVSLIGCTNAFVSRSYAPVALSGTTPTLDLSISKNATLTLTGSTTLSFSNLVDGDEGFVKVMQSSSLAYTLSVANGSFLLTNGTSADAVSTTAGSINILKYSYVAGTLYCSIRQSSSVATIYPVDTFNATNVTDIAGRATSSGVGTWVKVSGSGTFGITNNAAVVTSTPTGSTPKYTIDCGIRNIDARVTIGAKFASGPSLWLILAYTDDNNFLEVNAVDGSTYQVLSGTQTTLAAASGSSVVGDYIRGNLNGTTLTIYRNTTLLYTLTVSASLIGTKHGIFSYQDNGTTADTFSTQAAQ